MRITHNAPEVAKHLREVVPARARAGLRKGSRAAAKQLAAQLKSAIPSVTGTAKQEVKVRSLKRSRVRVGSTVRVWVRTGVKYYSFRDLGTKKLDGGRYFDKVAKAGGDAALRTMHEGIMAELDK